MRGWARRHATAALALAALGALAAGGCGKEKRFGAQEFVEAVRAEGVELTLGEELFTDDEDQELYALELEPATKLPGEGGEERHTGGSLSVFDDGEGAEREFTSCEGSADLLCYRAANVVVVLEGGGIEAQQLGIAMRRLSD